MIPIKPKQLIEEFCQSEKYKDMDPEHLELIITECFKELRREMETLSKPFIRMPNMGTWFIKIWSIVRELDRCENVLKCGKLKKQETVERYIVKRDRMTKVHEMVTSEFYTRMTNIKERNDKRYKKIRDEAQRDIPTSLGEQGTDS